MSETPNYGVSPLSGLPLSFAIQQMDQYRYYVGAPEGPWASDLDFDPEPEPTLYGSEGYVGFFRIASLRLREGELNKLKALAMGKVVQAKLRRSWFPLFVAASETATDQSRPKSNPYNFHQIAMEELWKEAQRLTFSQKAHETLVNLTLLEEIPGSELRIAVKLDPPREVEPPEINAPMDMRAYPLHGLVFGAIPGERTVVLSYLLEEGLIALGEKFLYRGGNPVITQMPDCRTIRITPKGYMLAEKIKSGDPSLTKKAFLVCASKASYRALYDQTCKRVGDHPDVQCEIKPVWAEPHVEKIDDRIFRLIREATIVIVDLDLKNFNVALEAGYALALGKPIVWTRKLPWRPKNPFDIYSHMVLQWSEDNPDKFEEDLRNQVLAAFDKAGVGQ